MGLQEKKSGETAFLAVMYVAAFVAAFNENIINVALNDIMGAFGVGATTAQWLVSGYMIVTSVFTAIMAYLSGRFSTRRLLFFACGCLVAGEVLCLVAPSFAVLLPSRILQAAGSGILFPLMMRPAREARPLPGPRRRVHHAGAGVWPCGLWPHVHAVWLARDLHRAARGRRRRGAGRHQARSQRG